MKRLCKQKGTADMKSIQAITLFGTVLIVLCFAYACGKDNASGSSSWSCDVTLTLVPSTLGNVSSPSGSGSGSGTGATQEEALRAALKIACSQLNLESDVRSQCESGQDFGVAVSAESVQGSGVTVSAGGGITLVSAVDRSQSCSGSSTF